MKIGICNLSGVQIRHNTSPNAGEIIELCKLLNDEDGVEAYFLNHVDLHKNKNDQDIAEYSMMFNETDPDYFDAILIMNSVPNFYGGLECKEVIDTFKFLAKRKKLILYIFNDANLPFKQLWPAIEKRSWNVYQESDVKITAPMIILSQFFNTEMSLKDNSKDDVNIISCLHYDFGTWMLQNFKKYESLKKYDFIYGGGFRSGRRKDKFFEYFTDNTISTALYGSVNEKNFREVNDRELPEFLGRVKHNEVIEKNREGFATIVLGEKKYNDNIHTIRLYEAISAGCVVFIDEEYDSKHVIFPKNPELYVNSKAEVEEMIIKLKNNNELYNNILNSEYEFITNKQSYPTIKKLISIINNFGGNHG